MTPTYVRTHRGRMIHKAGCRHLARATSAAPWNWAAGKSHADLVFELACIEVGGYDLCWTCFPSKDDHGVGGIR